MLSDIWGMVHGLVTPALLSLLGRTVVNLVVNRLAFQWARSVRGLLWTPLAHLLAWALLMAWLPDSWAGPPLWRLGFMVAFLATAEWRPLYALGDALGTRLGFWLGAGPLGRLYCRLPWVRRRMARSALALMMERMARRAQEDAPRRPFRIPADRIVDADPTPRRPSPYV